MRLADEIRDGLQTSTAQRCRTSTQHLSYGFLMSLLGASLHFLISVSAGCYFCLSLEFLPSTAGKLVSLPLPNL